MCRDTCEAMKVKLKNAAILIILSTGSENITEAAQGISAMHLYGNCCCYCFYTVLDRKTEQHGYESYAFSSFRRLDDS